MGVMPFGYILLFPVFMVGVMVGFLLSTIRRNAIRDETLLEAVKTCTHVAMYITGGTASEGAAKCSTRLLLMVDKKTLKSDYLLELKPFSNHKDFDKWIKYIMLQQGSVKFTNAVDAAKRSMSGEGNELDPFN